MELPDPSSTLGWWELIERVVHLLQSIWRWFRPTVSRPPPSYTFANESDFVEILLYAALRTAICSRQHVFLPESECPGIQDYPLFPGARVASEPNSCFVTIDRVPVKDVQVLQDIGGYQGAFLVTRFPGFSSGQKYTRWLQYECVDIRPETVHKTRDAFTKYTADRWTVQLAVREPTEKLTLEFDIADSALVEDVTVHLVERSMFGDVISRAAGPSVTEKSPARNSFILQVEPSSFARRSTEFEIVFSTYTNPALSKLRKIPERSPHRLGLIAMKQRIMDESKYYARGQVFQGISDIGEIIRSTRKVLVIVDAFMDEVVLKLVAGTKPGLRVILLTSDKCRPDFPILLQRFRKEKERRVSCLISRALHGRSIVADWEFVYVLDTSINDFASRGATLTPLAPGTTPARMIIRDIWDVLNANKGSPNWI